MATAVPARPAIACIDGWPINIADPAEAIREAITAARRGESFSLFTINLDHLVKLRASPPFRKAYRTARFITADGAPLVWLAARQGARVTRTTGADLVVPLAVAAAREGVPIYLFGTTPDVLEASGRYLQDQAGGGLQVVGAESPPRDFDPARAEADAALDRIAASGARLCFVALGAPKQELLAARAAERGIKVGFICIGAGLDFLAGAQVRAPSFMQRHGLEWLWRVATNPTRLAGRYARCALVLAHIVVRDAFKRRGASSARTPI